MNKIKYVKKKTIKNGGFKDPMKILKKTQKANVSRDQPLLFFSTNKIT